MHTQPSVTFQQDNVTGAGMWQVQGQNVDPARLPCPALSIRSRTDRIVPEACALAFEDDLLLDLGHVGMVTSRSAPELMWRPLADWIARQVER